MSLELIVISLMRTAKGINGLMLNSPDEDDTLPKSRVDVVARGTRWIDRDFEQFTRLGQFSEMNTNPDSGIAIDSETDDALALKLSLLNINDEALERQTVNVPIQGLRLLLNESMACGLHCTNCFRGVVGVRRFSSIRPMPICTMEPSKYFCSSDNPPSSMTEGELYYALNYIVISPKILSACVHMNGQHIHCGRCLQLVGESLGEKVAVQLYVDTLWVEPLYKGELRAGRLEHLFSELTVSQLMQHLLQDAVPISEEKTRLFLKTVRLDGQLHYMLLLVDTSQLHLMRFRLLEDTRVGQSTEKMDTDSESSTECSSKSSSESSSESDTESTDTSDEDELGIKRKLTTTKPVPVRGYRGCRVNYQIFCSDEELSANHELIEQWREQGTPMLRISYTMMMNLHHELKVNHLLVASLERNPSEDTDGLTSYIIYEPVAEI